MPMRVLTAMENEEPELVYDAATQIWHKIWSHDLDITDPAVITDALDKAGISNERAAYYIAKTQEQEIKNKLKEVTQEGLDCGMFGAPSYIVRQEGQDDVMFFGQGTDYNVHFSTLQFLFQTQYRGSHIRLRHWVKDPHTAFSAIFTCKIMLECCKKTAKCLTSTAQG